MLTAATGVTEEVLASIGGIVGGFGIIALLAFTVAYFRARRGQSFATLQSETIADLEAANEEKKERIAKLEEKLHELSERVEVLQEMVTQAAKVDLVRRELADGFDKLLKRLDRLDQLSR